MTIEIKKKTRKRLIINIDEGLHHELKQRALFNNVSLSMWIMQAVHDKKNREDLAR